MISQRSLRGWEGALIQPMNQVTSHGASVSPYVLNPESRNRSRHHALFAPEELEDAQAFFRTYPGYDPTPLRRLPSYAKELGIGELLVKDESRRMGLNAFKILGVSYAIHRMQLAGEISSRSILACATDGNHGRAVARAAGQFKLRARVFIPKHCGWARVNAIAQEGAEVSVIDGSYDEAVMEMARAATMNNWIVISDAAWAGQEIVPHYIMTGYTMIMEEAARQWLEIPDLVLVQAGVGGLAAAVVAWCLQKLGPERPFLVSCEPVSAACVLESMRAWSMVQVGGTLETCMAGLSCGFVSKTAWPTLYAGLDACVAITDEQCLNAVRKLAHPGAGDPAIVAGESGAAGVGALSAILTTKALKVVRDALHLGPRSSVFVINTEGATDPGRYFSIAGTQPD